VLLEGASRISVRNEQHAVRPVEQADQDVVRGEDDLGRWHLSEATAVLTPQAVRRINERTGLEVRHADC
jgi:hypothetical protein